MFGDACHTHHWVCHAYCLMDNHYHVVVETPEANLFRGMRQLNGVYTQRFNRQHNRVGHVFQGRYKAIHVEKDSYLLELARYVVLNPVRAGMVGSAKDWPWSSYGATASQTAPPAFLDVDWVLAAFGRRKSKAVEGYRQFVAEGKGQPSPWQGLRNQVYLGSDRFVDKMLNTQEGDKDLSEIPKSQRRPKPLSLARYESTACTRDEAIVMAYGSGGYTQKEIGAYFGLHYARVSRIISMAKSKT